MGRSLLKGAGAAAGEVNDHPGPCEVEAWRVCTACGVSCSSHVDGDGCEPCLKGCARRQPFEVRVLSAWTEPGPKEGEVEHMFYVHLPNGHVGRLYVDVETYAERAVQPDDDHYP